MHFLNHFIMFLRCAYNLSMFIYLYIYFFFFKNSDLNALLEGVCLL